MPSLLVRLVRTAGICPLLSPDWSVSRVYALSPCPIGPLSDRNGGARRWNSICQEGLSTDQSDTGSMGIFSCRTNQTQEAALLVEHLHEWLSHVLATRVYIYENIYPFPLPDRSALRASHTYMPKEVSKRGYMPSPLIRLVRGVGICPLPSSD
eukprot:584667-Pyramimonas_sp.AAC.3